MTLRPTPPTLLETNEWHYADDPQYDPPISPSSAYIVDSPSSIQNSQPTVVPHGPHPLSREASEEEPSFISETGQFHSAAHSPQLRTYPDPSQFPDPYPSYRTPHWHHGLSTPTLSSADSSTASTRSSAYTNSARSGDYGHVHVALGNDESNLSMGISTDDVAQLLAREVASSSLQQSRKSLTDQGRWSYAQSVRSRSSSVGNRKGDTLSEIGSPPLRATPSFDQAWASVDERDELGMTSEEETDDDILMDDEDEPEDADEEVTSAMMIAEEGRGIIVRGDDMPITQVQVNPGTTHLLIGSSTTPNAVPQFLTNVIPQIAHTLLCLDISANFLVALPPVLQACICLEELNIASNPLRALPIFLAGLTSLRVLIADSTGLTTLPSALESLEKLHTLSVRRNKMNSLPSWLCSLQSLETLLVDGNPFQGPWKALVEPLLAKVPMSPLYPPSTPIFPLPSASLTSMHGTATDDDDTSEPPSPENDRAGLSPEDEDTIMPPRAAVVSRSVTSPGSVPQRAQAPAPLSRTRTTPNKAYFDKYRAPSKSIVGSGMHASSSNADGNEMGELRKMKSAGELRRSHSGAPLNAPTSTSASASPRRPQLAHYATSASSSNLLAASPPHDSQAIPKRFASLGVASALSPEGMRQRPPLDPTVWGGTSPDKSDFGSRNATPAPADNYTDQPLMGSLLSKRDRDSRYTPSQPSRAKEEPKSSRWGFLKKMSMGKMRTDSPPVSRQPSRVQAHPQSRPVTMARSVSSASDAFMAHMSPQIDVRISTTGALLHANEGHTLSRKPSEDLLKSPPTIPEVSLSPSDDASTEVPQSPPPPLLSPTNLLVPMGPTPRSAKRRSFLPIEMTPIPIPAASNFMSGVTVTSDTEDDATARVAPSPIQVASMEQIQRREEEKAREARTRALRSVMAYLRDMHDLGLMQTSNTTSMYGGIAEAPGMRSRRPTLAEGGRMDSSVSSIASSSPSKSEPSQLRSSESRNALRSGSTTQTNSVATVASTDSGGSGGAEERKYKDDKGKRALILREIVETERTYVKGLQELADIYIKPASATVTVLSGVGQSVVPAAERKIVFSGLEALFSFHKESFLPALEKATAPIMRPQQLAETDTDGNLSLGVARAVAHIFVSHAAFMKMYSTYINNFDNSVQRLKAWVSEKPTNSPMSPPSSTAQLAGLGLTMSAVTAPSNMTDANSVSNNVAPLTTSQKKRIKAYLKRCRMNPRHSQLNLEGYLLLPVQRIPRYRLLLEELIRSCPPMLEYMEDPLDRALAEISSLATNMNEGKREAETRRKLVQWQSRIRGKFPSPLVQPHRRLIMDGPLHLTRVVRKATVSFEVIDSKGDASTVQVECLSPELTPRALIGVLCNDLLVLCRDPSEGQDPHSQVDLWAVLRMQTLPQPASIVHGNALRLVDNKAILYFEAPSTSDALTWFRAINLHIPASKA